MERRLEKNYLFCEPCFLSLFRPLFVRYIYRKYPTYISDKLCPKSDQKTCAKQVGYFRLIYRTNCGLNKWKKHASQNSFFRLIYRTNCALSRTKKHAQNKSDLSRTKKHAQNKSDISDLYIGQIVP